MLSRTHGGHGGEVARPVAGLAAVVVDRPAVRIGQVGADASKSRGAKRTIVMRLVIGLNGETPYLAGRCREGGPGRGHGIAPGVGSGGIVAGRRTKDPRENANAPRPWPKEPWAGRLERARGKEAEIPRLLQGRHGSKCSSVRRRQSSFQD